MDSKYIKTNPDGTTEGVHPDSLEADDFYFNEGSYKAIRAKCLDCAMDSVEVRLCTAYKCPLWAFRLGRKPKGLVIKRGKNVGDSIHRL